MTVTLNSDIIKEITDNVSEHDMLLRLSAEASKLASQCAAMAMQEPEGVYVPYSKHKEVENLNFRCAAVLSWMKALACVDVTEATVHKFLKQWQDCTCLQSELSKASTQYFTKDGMPIEVGKTYRGHSDRKIWCVTAINNSNTPHVIEVVNLGGTVARDVRPEWLVRM